MLAAAHRSAIASDWGDIWQLSTSISQHAIEYAVADGSARITALAQPPGNITPPGERLRHFGAPDQQSRAREICDTGLYRPRWRIDALRHYALIPQPIA